MQNIPVGNVVLATSPVGSNSFKENVPALPNVPFIARQTNESKLVDIVNNLTEQLKVKDERITYLTNLLLTQNQITEEKVVLPQSPSGPMQEVSTPAHKWNQVKARLESRYRKVHTDDPANKEYNEELEKANAELEAMEKS